MGDPLEQRRGRHGIALCLSGGGFRAALFHLGALRRLSEIGVLAELRTLSAVSGGSILAAFLAERLARGAFDPSAHEGTFETGLAAPFRRLVARDLRTGPVVRHVLWNWLLPGWRARALERAYRRHVSARSLADLPQRPAIVLCATDLTFGVNFEFSRERCGDYRAGYMGETARVPVAHAVAASSCFPPLFGPLPFLHAAELKGGDYREPDRARLLRRMLLTDGGVYDNLGLEPVWKSHAVVLVSDCGAPFELALVRNPLRRLLRYTQVVAQQGRALRLRSYAENLRRSVFAGTLWRLVRGRGEPAAEELGYREPLVGEHIAAIRTDLDHFSDAEGRILENHGYSRCELALRRRQRSLVAGGPPARVPHPEWLDERRVRAALHASHRRLAPRRIWRGLLRR